MTEQEIIREISCKEQSAHLHEIKINNISLYTLVRRTTRERLLKEAGLVVMRANHSFYDVSKINVIKSCIISFLHILKICIFSRTYSTVFLSFQRMDSVNGVYLDKFTDPLIESLPNDDYIIFEMSFGGFHRQPRLHSSHVCYIDFVHLFAKCSFFLTYVFFYLKYKKKITLLCDTMHSSFNVKFNYHRCGKEIYIRLVSIKILKFILKKISARRILGPSRDNLTYMLLISKQLNIKCFELQHGITYGETIMYSGAYDKMMIPDIFLAFGDNKPLNVYGIDERRIFNIGWAFHDYIKKLPQEGNCQGKAVLVISDPEITDAIFKIVLKLAKANPEITFYIRPHPHEVVTAQNMEIIRGHNNINIQNKNINITVTLQGFKYVIGENSTVLYEALAINKRVGKLFSEGLNPRYLDDSDRSCFWEIKNQDDFIKFIEDSSTKKTSRSIYSPFNRQLFLDILYN